jgi:hypothetical protein
MQAHGLIRRRSADEPVGCQFSCRVGAPKDRVCRRGHWNTRGGGRQATGSGGESIPDMQGSALLKSGQSVFESRGREI